MEAGAQDDETKAEATGATTPDGGSASPVTIYTPLFRAQHEGRYRRRDLIQDYQRRHSCNLVVLIDLITQDSVTLFAELLHGLDCSIDPQVLVSERGYVSAKDLIEAVDSALNDVATRPDTYPLHAAMLAGIDSTAVQFARSALASTDELARQAISSNPDRSKVDIEKLCLTVRQSLINQPKMHSAVVGSREARQAGLPVCELEADNPWWQEIWHLWTQYYALGPTDLLQAYEGAKASQVRVLRSVGSHDQSG